VSATSRGRALVCYVRTDGEGKLRLDIGHKGRRRQLRPFVERPPAGEPATAPCASRFERLHGPARALSWQYVRARWPCASQPLRRTAPRTKSLWRSWPACSALRAGTSSSRVAMGHEPSSSNCATFSQSIFARGSRATRCNREGTHLGGRAESGRRVTSGATCASQADCQGAHESCVRSDPTSTTGHCQSVRVPRDENRRARVKPSGQHRRVTCLRFVQEYRGQRIVTDGKLYGVEGELPTDCRYLNVKGGTRSHRLGGLHRAAQEAGAPAPYCPQFSKMKSASASHVSGPVPTTMAAFCAAGGPSRRAYRANPKKPVAG
jgi:hypothetical protein